MECDFKYPSNPNFDPATIVQNNTLNVTKVGLLKEQLYCKPSFKVNEGKILSSKSASKKLGFSFLLDPQLNDQLSDGGGGRLVKNFFDGFKVRFSKNKTQYLRLRLFDSDFNMLSQCSLNVL